jgi:hypothetical protein
MSTKEPKLNNDGTPRKKRISALSKAQSELAKLEEKRNEINVQISALKERCIQLYAKSDPDIKAKALGTPTKSEDPK